MMLIFPLMACLCGQISADHWSRPLTLVPGDGRTYVVLFFSSRGDKDKTKDCVERLNMFNGRKDILTLAVTPERQPTADAFIRTFKPRFAVGSKSPSYKAYRITRFPTLLVLRPKLNRQESGAIEVLDVTAQTRDELEQCLAPMSTPPPQADVDILKQFVRSSTASNLRDVAETLESLRKRLPAKEFIAFCDEIEWQCGFNGRWLGQVRYERHLADDTQPVKQADPPSRDAIRTLRDMDPQSAEVQEMQHIDDLIASLPITNPAPWLELRGKYDSPTAPLDLACRVLLAQTFSVRIGACIDGELEAGCLPPLVDLARVLYDAESDAGIRYLLLLGLMGLDDEDIVQVPELPAWLASKLEAERDIRWVRPMLEQILFESCGTDP